MTNPVSLGDTIETTTAIPIVQTIRCTLVTQASVAFANEVLRESSNAWRVVRSGSMVGAGEQ
ncbi:hypothetical protein R70006_06303 [Paraburkholderia domus]|uniref:hypothetical protein n=1 Tax=Paraburkholderia domus TaxID=2793075 RepID=UPI001913848A|nr:hypothetical protein [Paraburkholderia domus]MBK5052931.1 hypothetical protein [Burkholderia sp. R-70006]CAE6823142.1 hypothetical protein R70006_06303 [Paraburkholderia domus]